MLHYTVSERGVVLPQKVDKLFDNSLTVGQSVKVGQRIPLLYVTLLDSLDKPVYPIYQIIQYNIDTIFVSLKCLFLVDTATSQGVLMLK